MKLEFQIILDSDLIFSNLTLDIKINTITFVHCWNKRLICMLELAHKNKNK